MGAGEQLDQAEPGELLVRRGEPDPRIGVWFRHFRRVKDVRYYGDLKTNAHNWERITMTDTISPLRDEGSLSYRLINEWLASAQVNS